MIMIKTFLETTFQDVRSSRRTAVLHKEILKELLETTPEWSDLGWVFEYKLKEDGYGGTFDIDIAGFKDGNLTVAVLAKAINSNVAKNHKNFANTTIGEIHRLMDAPNLSPLEKVLFISYYPRMAPVFTGGKLSRFDNVPKSKSRTNINPILKKYWGERVISMDLYYDIGELENKVSKGDFDNIEPENIDEINFA
jgi:hypothetical protein